MKGVRPMKEGRTMKEGRPMKEGKSMKGVRPMMEGPYVTPFTASIHTPIIDGASPSYMYTMSIYILL